MTDIKGITAALALAGTLLATGAAPVGSPLAMTTSDV